jgi:hypothetical protein
MLTAGRSLRTVHRERDISGQDIAQLLMAKPDGSRPYRTYVRELARYSKPLDE